MNPLIVLNLGPGNCQDGLDNITAQLWLEGYQVPNKYRGSLPASTNIPQLYKQWRALYEALNNPYGYRHRCRLSASDGIEFEAESYTNVSREEFRELCQQLKNEINQWLSSPGFRNIDQQLRIKLNADETIRVIIETDNDLLQKLPWHLWHFFDHYSKAEVALSAQEYQKVSPVTTRDKQQMRILVVLGHSEGINTQPDRILLEDADAESFILKEPRRSKLDKYLWDEQGWDILFFAGHSTSQAIDTTGIPTEQLFINPNERLAVDQLRNALKAAISRGLKLAIFNSCDGLGLARALADLNLPQLIVMREPVTDPVAHTFLQNFLQVFSRGEAFYTAVRHAREKLQGIEGEFPGASWLPVIFQNPTALPITWAKSSSEELLAPPLEEYPDQSSTPTPPQQYDVIESEADSSDGTSTSITWCQLLFTSVAVTLSVVVVRTLGLLQPLELSAYDHLMRSRPPELDQPEVDQRLLVVEITEDDTDQYGYPITDKLLATTLERLQKHQPSTIGIDLHRYQANQPGREQLIDQFNQSPDVVTVCSFGRDDREIMGHPPEFSDTQVRNQVGFSDLETDDIFHREHPVIRRQLLSYDPNLSSTASSCITPYSFSLNLALRFLQAQDVQPLSVNTAQNWQLGSVIFKRLRARTGGYQQLDGQSSQILLNYRFTPKPAHRVSLSDVLNDQISDELIRNRVILIGVTDEPVGNDYRQTPYGELPGVWVHAHGVSQVLAAVLDDRTLMWVFPQWGRFQWGDLLWIWGWAVVGGILVWRIRSGVLLGVAGVIVILGLRQICLLILIQGGWVPLIPALLTLGGTVGVLLIRLQGELPIKIDALVSDLTWKRS